MSLSTKLVDFFIKVLIFYCNLYKIEPMKTLTYFGFAANPPHLGHLSAIAWLSSNSDLVLVSPSASHAFGKNMQSYSTRMRWAQELLNTCPLPNVQLSDIESRMADAQSVKAPVYSYDVLAQIAKEYPEYSIKLAVGPDNADMATWKKFYKYQDIDSEFGRVVIPEMTGVVRSTYIRNLFQTTNVTYEMLLPLVGKHVAADLINKCGDLKW